jgi:hypothetical protein
MHKSIMTLIGSTTKSVQSKDIEDIASHAVVLRKCTIMAIRNGGATVRKSVLKISTLMFK